MWVIDLELEGIIGCSLQSVKNASEIQGKGELNVSRLSLLTMSPLRQKLAHFNRRWG